MGTPADMMPGDGIAADGEPCCMARVTGGWGHHEPGCPWVEYKSAQRDEEPLSQEDEEVAAADEQS